MQLLGVGADESTELLQITAAVLHLGNVTFEENSEGQAVPSNSNERSVASLQLAAELLGLEFDELVQALTFRCIDVAQSRTMSPPNRRCCKHHHGILGLHFVCQFVSVCGATTKSLP